MTDILARAELRTPEQARAVLASSTLPWIGEQLKQGRELVLEVRLLEDDITDKQRGFLHAVVLTEIAQGKHYFDASLNMRYVSRLERSFEQRDSGVKP